MSSESAAVQTTADGATALGTATETSSCQQQTLSKNQMKKQRKREKWLQIKAEKRQAEKEKRKKRFAEMRERGEDIGPSRKSLKKKRMVDSACQLRVVIDCSFDKFMSEKDITFLVQQIQHSYAANRRAENPLQLYICGIGGKAKQRLDSIGDYRGWDLHKEVRDYTDVFPKEEIVYLSSESPNVLETLDDTKVYVIGGLVDHNHHKGLCHKLAEEKGLAHAQLPIAQFLQLKSRKVLTINHVFEILLRFTETKDWQASFLTVLPQRKGVHVRDSKEKGMSSENSLDPKEKAPLDTVESKTRQANDPDSGGGLADSSSLPGARRVVANSETGVGVCDTTTSTSEHDQKETGANLRSKGDNKVAEAQGQNECCLPVSAPDEGVAQK